MAAWSTVLDLVDSRLADASCRRVQRAPVVSTLEPQELAQKIWVCHHFPSNFQASPMYKTTYKALVIIGRKHDETCITPGDGELVHLIPCLSYTLLSFSCFRWLSD